ncbi:hypothetical protein ACLOJK_002127 [Asimina triloba]
MALIDGPIAEIGKEWLPLFFGEGDGGRCLALMWKMTPALDGVADFWDASSGLDVGSAATTPPLRCCHGDITDLFAALLAVELPELRKTPDARDETRFLDLNFCRPARRRTDLLTSDLTGLKRRCC